jgi:hypothetical protein
MNRLVEIAPRTRRAPNCQRRHSHPAIPEQCVLSDIEYPRSAGVLGNTHIDCPPGFRVSHAGRALDSFPLSASHHNVRLLRLTGSLLIDEDLGIVESDFLDLAKQFLKSRPLLLCELSMVVFVHETIKLFL